MCSFFSHECPQSNQEHNLLYFDYFDHWSNILDFSLPLVKHTLFFFSTLTSGQRKVKGVLNFNVCSAGSRLQMAHRDF